MTLNCKISKGVVDSCQPNVSGVLRMAIANWSEDYKYTESSGDCLVDTIDLQGEKAYPFAIMDGTGVATSTGTIGGNNDSRYHQHSVGGSIAKLDCDLLGDYNNFFLGRVVIFVETKNREVFVFGADNGLTASTWEYTTGTAEGDANGISFVFEGAQPNAPIKIASWEVVKSVMA